MLPKLNEFCMLYPQKNDVRVLLKNMDEFRGRPAALEHIPHKPQNLQVTAVIHVCAERTLSPDAVLLERNVDLENIS